MTVLDRVQFLIKKKLGKEEIPITMDTDLIAEFSVNSLELTEIICAFEDEFDLEIPDRDIKKFRYIRDIVNYLEARVI